MEFVQGIYTLLHDQVFPPPPPPSDPFVDYLTLLPRFLPPTLAHPLLTIFTSAFGIMRALQTHLSPFLTRILAQPDVASVLLLVTLLLASFWVLNMAYRAVMFWVRLVSWFVMWGGVMGLGFWVYTRGPEQFVQDVQELATYWWDQYERFAGEAKGWQKAEEAQIHFQARQQQQGRGWGRRGGY
jgi:hypothetical protein